MPSGNLQGAINDAMAFCWDEGYGYRQPGMGHGYADGFDCSGLIGRVLSDNGFNYPSTHVGTKNMDDNPMSTQNTLGNAGFQLIHVTDLNNIPPLQSGDIVVMNKYDWNDWHGTGGHTFFYVENIQAYTDPNAVSANIGLCSKAKVEASSDRGHSAPGDSRKNGNGAYWEVWCHAYSTLIPSSYNPQSTTEHCYVTIARWLGGNSSSEGATQYLLSQYFRKRRLEDANITDWIDL